MIPWLIAGLAASLAVAVIGWSGFCRCCRRQALRRSECAQRFLFLELHEAELSEAKGVWLRIVDDRCFAVCQEFAEREREQHRPPRYMWREVLEEISRLCTGHTHTPPLPGMTLDMAGLESRWVVSICEPDRQIRLARENAAEAHSG
jgi:hypothetical protein